MQTATSPTAPPPLDVFFAKLTQTAMEAMETMRTVMAIGREAKADSALPKGLNQARIAAGQVLRFVSVLMAGKPIEGPATSKATSVPATAATSAPAIPAKDPKTAMPHGPSARTRQAIEALLAAVGPYGGSPAAAAAAFVSGHAPAPLRVASPNLKTDNAGAAGSAAPA